MENNQQNRANINWLIPKISRLFELTTWKNSFDGLIFKYDVVIVKNCLNEEELAKLNALTNMFLVFAEDETKKRHVMTMQGLRMIYWNLEEKIS